mmetsp:Transcript_36070/g.117845  ORF Transcript_36070/g.117845 Transcript_36070/m.117845 type:complete len:335 (+) Transcript_36070:842-1846(+)
MRSSRTCLRCCRRSSATPSTQTRGWRTPCASSGRPSCPTRSRRSPSTSSPSSSTSALRSATASGAGASRRASRSPSSCPAARWRSCRPRSPACSPRCSACSTTSRRPSARRRSRRGARCLRLASVSPTAAALRPPTRRRCSRSRCQFCSTACCSLPRRCAPCAPSSCSSWCRAPASTSGRTRHGSSPSSSSRSPPTSRRLSPTCSSTRPASASRPAPSRRLASRRRARRRHMRRWSSASPSWTTPRSARPCLACQRSSCAGPVCRRGAARLAWCCSSLATGSPRSRRTRGSSSRWRLALSSRSAPPPPGAPTRVRQRSSRGWPSPSRWAICSAR